MPGQNEQDDTPRQWIHAITMIADIVTRLLEVILKP